MEGFGGDSSIRKSRNRVQIEVPCLRRPKIGMLIRKGINGGANTIHLSQGSAFRRQSRIFRQSTDFPHQPCPGRRSQLSFWKPIDKKEVSARSFLVPDITPNAGQTAETVRRALEAADSMALWEVGVRTIIEIAIFLFIGRIIISFAGKLARRADEVIEREKAKTSRPNYARVIADAGIRAAQDPVKILVPVVVALLSLQTITQALQIWVEDEMFRNYHALFRRGLKGSFRLLCSLERFAGEFWQLGVIAATLWLLLDWKERLVRVVMDLEARHKEKGDEDFRLDRIVLPMSQLGGWAMIAVGGLTALHVLGINIQPLLAVGGVSGIAIGFGAQTVTANAIAGVNLFLTRPFVVGDRVELQTSSGGRVMVGVVEKIDPMRTVLRTDDNIPVAVPNKAITDMIVCNESRINRINAVTEFKDPRQYHTEFKVKNGDFEKVPKILTEIVEYLKSANGVDKLLPLNAQLKSLGDSAVTIGITAHTTSHQSRDFTNFNHDILMAVADIMKTNNVNFA